MKTSILLIGFYLFSSIAFCQPAPGSTAKPLKITENSVVKDSLGNVYPSAIWRKLLGTGRYSLKAENPANDNAAFILTRLTEEQYSKRLEKLPKPKESSSFVTGKKFFPIKARDINGKKINTKAMAGKIIVINFWFIKCPPCIMEMPELNKLTDEYAQDSSVVFISVALDDEASLGDFLSSTTFKYAVIGNGRLIAADYNIRSYPTNLVVSPEGTVYFHASGYSGIATTHWLKKSIEELKEKMQPVVAAAEGAE